MGACSDVAYRCGDQLNVMTRLLAAKSLLFEPFNNSMSALPPRVMRPRTRLAVVGIAAAALATAAWVAQRARRAEQANPPIGAFINVGGVRLHYLAVGEGTPIVLLHGNVLRLEDYVASGLIERLAERYRVIAFDRPGFGYSERPRDRLWTARAQADVLERALRHLRVEQPIVVGHSWGTLVALELACRESVGVRKLILMSGYYFPTPRIDVALATPPAIPLVGDVMRYTVSAALARLLLGRTVKAMFAPQQVPSDFLAILGRDMLVRPNQIRANSEDAALMLPAAAALRQQYGELNVSALIIAGEADKVADPNAHARRLHAELKDSQLVVLPGVGHMLHHAAQDLVSAAIARCEMQTSQPQKQTERLASQHEPSR